jgi:hypothetical protein
MNNEILFQNDLYTVLDISTNSYPNFQTLVDNEELVNILKHKWIYTIHEGYIRVTSNKSPHIDLSRYLMNPPEDMIVDHINHNRLINIKANLRICTRRQNTMNQQSKNVYKGVSQVRNGKYVAYQAAIGYLGNKIHLGTFKTPEKAAEIYDNVARLLYGEFAALNEVINV